ncbi:PD-(D/E)XK nuclease family protein [Anaerobacillus isosaccharinicus]|uniref:PD-(D/E)XK nuclease family protein n=1 Tax=Anaerobacillus isosaccharinicus TaxID=1532552 RepID=A0A1S2MDA8_9BACI|nr:PD-(D/E)XK nuclease family protein [Anaerobacillus isosaccharinicus]MBA5587796.1 PD-(D/E)XK nuclease family protein [Anaerobacillus isosaccharinicus]QOY34047.1 PD-(D/E)XK nuclease family protein [Anaerobacillus isosaccharinicus]
MLVVKSSPITEVANIDRLTESFNKQKELGKPIYYILPSNKYLQEARKQKKGMAFKTFDDLADLVLKKANIDFFPVSESERTLFFQELIARDKKRFLQKPEELRHKAKAYAETYGQLKRIGLTISDLPSQFKEMEAVFQEYETEWVQKQRLLDPENRIHKAVSLMRLESLNLGGIVIDGYLDFSTLQYMVINYFVSLGLDITVYLPAIEEAEILEETKTQLQNLGFEIENSKALMIGNAPSVAVSSATTLEEEIHGVLQEISDNLAETPLSEVAILLADEKNYLERVVKVAKEKQIPLKRPLKKQMKDSLLFQFIHHSLLKHNGRFSSRWDFLDLTDTLLRLQFLPSFDYMTKKKAYVETGFLDEQLKEEINFYVEFRKALPKKAGLYFYLSTVKDLLEKSHLLTTWREQLISETCTIKLQQIRFEWKAFDYLFDHISKKMEMLANQGLKELEVHYHIFVEWLNEGLQSGSIFVDRAPIQGVQLYSFRDIALFKGTHIYVLGMNEGTFPKGHKLSGYLQESDLKKLPIPFAAPTGKLFRKKDDAFFQQLFSLASKLSFSYVVGVDPHNPFLPSGYLEHWKSQIQERKYSTANRFAFRESYSKEDYEAKIAYHIGLGKQVPNPPLQLERFVEKLAYLEVGKEEVSPPWKEKLRRDKLSVTMLESYAMCPFKYALERILKIKEPLEKRVIIDFRDVGSMLHTIIEKFYKQLNLVGKPFSTFTDDMKELADAALMEIFEEEWAVVEAGHLDFSKLQLSIEKEEWQKKIKRWWLAEKQHFWENKQLQSMHLFRLEEAIELDLKIDEETTITLSGKIDRIDIDENGFVIYDYKSGAASLNFEKEVRPGLKLQLPLYLVAMENRLENGHYTIDLTNTFPQLPAKLTAHGASYISLKEPLKRAGNSVWREEHFEKSNPFSVTRFATKEETLEGEVFLAKYELKQRLRELWEGSTQNFSVKPLKCITSCLYKPVCRVTQDQIEEGEEEWK